MPYNLNIPSIIQALAQFVQVLDQHQFGAVMLVLAMMVAAALILAVRPSSRSADLQ